MAIREYEEKNKAGKTIAVHIGLSQPKELCRRCKTELFGGEKKGSEEANGLCDSCNH